MAKAKKRIKKQLVKVKDWVKENRREAAILALILLVGAFIRLYRIDEYMTFLGDEGRDVIVVRRLIVDFDPILIGPRTSIGDMYLGPLYYYMMAPALALSFLSPVGPAVMIAVLGVATILLVWWIGREWFPSASSGKASIAGPFAAGLYAISPVVIIHSRHSWNPNIMPFFALLTIYGLWRVWRRNESKWLIVLGISFAFVLQSHYLGLLLVPLIGLFWLWTLKAIRDNRKMKREFIKYSVLSAALFALLMSPLVIFDARHGWRNFAAMKQFFTVRQTTISARPWTAIPKLPQIVPFVTSRLVAGKNETVGVWVALTLFAGVIGILTSILYSNVVKNRKLERHQRAYLLLLFWMGVAFIGLSVYKQHIYDHYYGFFFTAPFLLMGGLAQNIADSVKIGKIVVLVAFILLVYVNLAENPLKYSPNRQLQRTEEVANKIRTEAKEKDFNLAVIAERNYEDAYQYFLEKWRKPVIDIDPQRSDETITEQLFVVCELAKEDCNPVSNPKAEVANFGWSKIENEWEISGVILYKLIHTK